MEFQMKTLVWHPMEVFSEVMMQIF